MTKEKLSEIMVDVALADQIINLHNVSERDSIRKILRESLLKVHNVTQSELDTNLYLYMSDLEEFEEIIDLMITRNDSIARKYAN